MVREIEDTVPNDYYETLDEIKRNIRRAQIKAGQSVTKRLILLYWKIGRELQIRLEKSSWGSNTIRKLTDHDVGRVFANGVVWVEFRIERRSQLIEMQ